MAMTKEQASAYFERLKAGEQVTKLSKELGRTSAVLRADLMANGFDPRPYITKYAYTKERGNRGRPAKKPV